MTTKFQTSLGIIEIGNACYETYPCMHDVIINGKSIGTRFSTSIEQLFISAERPDLAKSFHSIVCPIEIPDLPNSWNHSELEG